MSRARARLATVIAVGALLVTSFAVRHQAPAGTEPVGPSAAADTRPMTASALASDTSEPFSVLAARWATEHPPVDRGDAGPAVETGSEAEWAAEAESSAESGEDPDAVSLGAGPDRIGAPEAGEPGGERRMPDLPIGPRRPAAVPHATQTTRGGAPAAVVGATIEGLGQGFTGPFGTFSLASIPPDVNGDVGDRQYIETVNTQLAVFDKATGVVQLGPVNINALWSGFGGLCQSDNDGDPTVRWDGLASRWVVTQFAVSGTSSTNPYRECVAVSATSDGTGRWYRYAFSHANFPDYPKLSIWPNAYYVTYNYFGRRFIGGVICAYPRERLLAGPDGSSGTPIDGTCSATQSQGSILVSDLDATGPTDLPPAGAKAVAVAFDTSSSLAAWTLDYVPGSNTLTMSSAPVSIPVESFSYACGGGTCIPQSGTSTKLDSLGDRLMYRFAYRPNADRTGGTAVVAHSVAVNSVSGIRWYRLGLTPGGAASLLQQGTYQPDPSWRWMPSIAQDVAGNIAVGYSTSSSSSFPSIRFAARTDGSAAALGTLDVAEGTIQAGGGAQNGSYTRWGDYTNMSLDPDGCTFWYVSEYYPANHPYNWHTLVGRFSIAPACTNGSYTRLAATVATSDGANVSVAGGSKLTVTATVKDESNGASLAGRTVVFTAFGKSAWATTNAQGVASVSFTAPRKSGTQTTVTRQFFGDWGYTPASGTSTAARVP